jgi:transmembrane sensor
MGLNTDPREEDWANNASKLPDLQEEAIEWVVRLTSGAATDADRSEFERWRAQSPEHEAAASAARQLWVGVGHSLTAADVAPETETETEHEEVTAKSRRRLLPPPRMLALAASVLLTMFLGFQTFHSWRHDHVAATGEQGAFELTDGTAVTLNSGSALDVRYTRDARHVTLSRGEAFFDVAHNPDVPFIVEAGSGQVRVVGTAFAVRRDENDRVVVTVERGRVAVRSGERSTLLTVDQKVHYQNGVLARVEPANPYTDLAWRRGRLIVEDQPLSNVVAELNRYYSGRIIVSGDAAGARRLNAVIDLKHIDQWLSALDESQPIEIRHLGPLTILRSSR